MILSQPYEWELNQIVDDPILSVAAAQDIFVREVPSQYDSRPLPSERCYLPHESQHHPQERPSLFEELLANLEGMLRDF